MNGLRPEYVLREVGLDWVADDHLADYCYQKLAQTGQYIEISGQRIRLGSGDEKARKKTSNKWFETQDSISYWDDLYKPKIAWGNLNLSGTYSFVPEGVFINAPSTFISTSKRIILHILNSRLADFYIRSLGVTRNGGYFEYKPMFVDKLPVPQNHIEFKELEEFSIYPSDIEKSKIQNII